MTCSMVCSEHLSRWQIEWVYADTCACKYHQNHVPSAWSSSKTRQIWLADTTWGRNHPPPCKWGSLGTLLPFGLEEVVVLHARMVWDMFSNYSIGCFGVWEHMFTEAPEPTQQTELNEEVCAVSLEQWSEWFEIAGCVTCKDFLEKFMV